MDKRKPESDAASGSDIAISVIISTYNACPVVADCLRSIYDNPPTEPYEILLVDDASTDGTSAMVRTRFPEVRLLRNDVNRHYTFSNNRALHEARGQFLLLLNNDTIVLPEAIDRMLAFLRQYPRAGAVGSKLLNEDGTIQWSVKSLPDFGSALFGARSIITRAFPNNRYSRKRLLHLDRDMTTPFVAGYVSGASKMMPRKVVAEVGDLDHRMFYHVDADYCKRIAEAGYECYYLPTAAVVHLNHKGGTMVSPRLRFRSLLSFHIDSYLYYRKHLRRSPWSLSQIGVVFGLSARFLALAATQLGAELVGGIRSLPRAKRSAG